MKLIHVTINKEGSTEKLVYVSVNLEATQKQRKMGVKWCSKQKRVTGTRTDSRR